MGLFDKVKKSVSKTTTELSTNFSKRSEMNKLETELEDINNRYNDCYLIIGKRIAEFLRQGEDIDDAKVNEAFGRIVKFDNRKFEIEAKLKEFKGDDALRRDAQELALAEEEAETEIKKLKDLLDSGVYDQEEYDRKVALVRNKVKYYKQLKALDQAFHKELIKFDEYKEKKAKLLGTEIEE